MAAPTESSWSATDEMDVDDVTVGEILRRAAAAHPDRVALVAGVADPDERRRWTYAELLVEAERCARALLGRFDPGDHVAVWAPNIAEWVILEFGAGLAGIVLVTVNPAYQAGEVRYILDQSRSVGCFVAHEHRGNPMRSILEEVRPDLPGLRDVVCFDDWDDFTASADDGVELPIVDPDDPAQIQYTSGTTGFPKGALLHHRGICNNGTHTAHVGGATEGQVWLNPMPLFHTGGCVLGTLGCAATAGTHIPLLAFDPALALEIIETERVERMGAVPTMLVAMMEHPDFSTRDLSSLTGVVSGGSTVPADLVRRIEDALEVSFVIVFGQTECSPVASMTRPGDAIDDKASTIGLAMPRTEIQIVDPSTGEVVPIGEVGEYCTRGYHVMLGYHEMDDATAEAIDAEGWLHTGDLCAMDDRGYCTVEGRLKDMIIRGGENIYPRELEELLFARDDVAEVAVVGLPDDRWGEVVGAFVRPAGGSELSTAELTSHLRDHLAPHKTPARWFAVDEFPLTGSGKIQKFKLREQWEAGEHEAIRGALG
ncbi:AMP-binding protein [Ilumatobacter sp.]|uniref:AMP-binding protein n=1 Tax=Ilumatobacter sp. TaxID=1967498 RepID=UPI003B51FCF3